MGSSELKEMVKDLLKENRVIKEDMRELKSGWGKLGEEKRYGRRERSLMDAKKGDKEWVVKRRRKGVVECETEEVRS